MLCFILLPLPLWGAWNERLMVDLNNINTLLFTTREGYAWVSHPSGSEGGPVRSCAMCSAPDMEVPSLTGYIYYLLYQKVSFPCASSRLGITGLYWRKGILISGNPPTTILILPWQTQNRADPLPCRGYGINYKLLYIGMVKELGIKSLVDSVSQRHPPTDTDTDWRAYVNIPGKPVVWMLSLSHWQITKSGWDNIAFTFPCFGN